MVIYLSRLGYEVDSSVANLLAKDDLRNVSSGRLHFAHHVDEILVHGNTLEIDEVK